MLTLHCTVLYANEFFTMSVCLSDSLYHRGGKIVLGQVKFVVLYVFSVYKYLGVDLNRVRAHYEKEFFLLLPLYLLHSKYFHN